MIPRGSVPRVRGHRVRRVALAVLLAAALLVLALFALDRADASADARDAVALIAGAVAA
jgi:hypothetical protein